MPFYLIAERGASLLERSGYWRDRFWWDFAAPDGGTLDFFMQVADRIGDRAVLLPVTDWTAQFVNDPATRTCSTASRDENCAK